MIQLKFVFFLAVVGVSSVLGVDTTEQQKAKVDKMVDEHRAAVQYYKYVERDMSLGYAPDTYIDNIIEEYLNSKDNTIGLRNLKELDELEAKANKTIMILKQLEYEKGMKWPAQFLGIYDVFDILDKIQNLKLYKLVNSMPKGGILHWHQSAMSTLDKLVNLASIKEVGVENYKYLYLAHHIDNELDVRGFRFGKKKDELKKPPSMCTYTLLGDVVTRLGNGSFERGEPEFLKNILRPLLTLNKTEHILSKPRFTDIGQAWTAFNLISQIITGLMNFTPLLRKHLKNGLETALDDNILHVEIKATLGLAYDLKNPKIDPVESFKIYKEVCGDFVKNETAKGKYFNAKLIYSPAKSMPSESDHQAFFKTYLELVKEDRKDPGFLAGFDLTGPEESTPMLDYYLRNIKDKLPDTKFFFHAGETNFFGTFDENLFDAIQMPCKRIGHGNAITKHPEWMELAKKKDICFEVSPISNVVLKLNYDFRTHPINEMVARGVQVVLSSDDPSFWNTKTLSDDMFLVLQYALSYEQGLPTMKRFLTNSLKYSAMTEDEKNKAIKAWFKKYVEWLRTVVKEDVKKEEEELKWLIWEREDPFKNDVPDSLREKEVRTEKPKLTREDLDKIPYQKPATNFDLSQKTKFEDLLAMMTGWRFDELLSTEIHNALVKIDRDSYDITEKTEEWDHKKNFDRDRLESIAEELRADKKLKRAIEL